MRRAAVEIGDPHGRIALFLDYQDAWSVADSFPYPDLAGGEMIEAIQKAYPERCHAEGCCDPKTCTQEGHE